MDTEQAWDVYLNATAFPVNALPGERDAFMAGAEWARKQTLEEAEAAVRPNYIFTLETFSDDSTLGALNNAADRVRALGESR